MRKRLLVCKEKKTLVHNKTHTFTRCGYLSVSIVASQERNTIYKIDCSRILESIRRFVNCALTRDTIKEYYKWMGIRYLYLLSQCMSTAGHVRVTRTCKLQIMVCFTGSMQHLQIQSRWRTHSCTLLMKFLNLYITIKCRKNK